MNSHLKRAFFALLFLISFHPADAVVGGTPITDDAVQKAFGLNLGNPRSALDTPEIPIGPRVSITCGHCAPQTDNFFPPQMQASADATDALFDALTAGTYGLDFRKKASYPYDLAVIIFPADQASSGPFVSIGKTRVQKGDAVTVLGKGRNTSSPGALCDGFSETHHFDYAPFSVIDFYEQNVGFISSGLNKAVTCNGDSGAYYLRTVGSQLELVGINSWGTEGGMQEISNSGAVLNYVGFMSGAGDLTSPDIQAWLTQLAAQNNVEICGINKDCPEVVSPFQVGGKSQ